MSWTILGYIAAGVIGFAIGMVFLILVDRAVGPRF